MNFPTKLPELPKLGAPGMGPWTAANFVTPHQVVNGMKAAPLGSAYGPLGNLLQPGQVRTPGGK